jgi:hypothetical protein
MDPAEIQVWLAEVPQARDLIPLAVQDLTADPTTDGTDRGV